MKNLPQSGGSYTVDAKGGLKQTVAPPKPAPRPKPPAPKPAPKKEA
ncbi:hypothetical protein KUV64_05320 [Mameliella alba]|nr:hypothetical protein [Mameliella alba]MBY6118542.1 hypothetical protein [Mameliella alba]